MAAKTYKGRCNIITGAQLKIEILDGRKDRIPHEGTAVLVDILRSTTTMPILLKQNASYILPCATIKRARAIKREHPDYVIAGERYGFKVPRFEYGNSPSEIWGIDFKGKTVIFTSTNGTKILEKIHVDRVFIASFVNASGTLSEIAHDDEVYIIASGRPDGYADEDFIFAEYLESFLKGEKPSFADYKKKIMESSGARRLSLIGFARDLDYAVKLDTVDFPVVARDGKIFRYGKVVR
ncbi:MAG: 2-phosphosulfolactate phosphatase [Candidatus Thermoplasmatota archaeon]|nr:2-phosphosulfolactate phosphatase [Candidatus Thermoplasmatota archaeon]